MGDGAVSASSRSMAGASQPASQPAPTEPNVIWLLWRPIHIHHCCRQKQQIWTSPSPAVPSRLRLHMCHVCHGQPGLLPANCTAGLPLRSMQLRLSIRFIFCHCFSLCNDQTSYISPIRKLNLLQHSSRFAVLSNVRLSHPSRRSQGPGVDRQRSEHESLERLPLATSPSSVVHIDSPLATTSAPR